MASRLILHIGLQKSGTTYLQRVLAGSAARLAGAGLCYPLPGGPRRVDNHEPATYGLLGEEYAWVSAARADRERPGWLRLLDEVERSSDAVLLSAEALSVIRAPAISALLDRFSATEVAVVVTARSLSAALPSFWQQHVRNGRGAGFDSYLRMLADQRRLPVEELEAGRELHMWRALRLGGLVRRWAAEVGMPAVTVVTSQGGPPERLWNRFTEAIGRPELAGVPAPDLLARQVHTGISAPETLVLAAMNTALERQGWPAHRAQALRQRVCLEGFAGRPDRGPRVTVPAAWRPTVMRWIVEDVTDLQETGVRIVGDVGDLCAVPDPLACRPATAEDVAAASAAAVLAVAPDEAVGPAGASRAARRIRARQRLRGGWPRSRTRGGGPGEGIAAAAGARHNP